MMSAQAALGRVIALDLGEKRIGVALSDESRTIARSHAVLTRRSRREDFARLAAIAHEASATLLLVGLPVSLSAAGEPLETLTPRAAWMRDYATALASELGLPLRFWDESLSTVEAHRSLRARDRSGRRARETIDAVAAALILQGFLDGSRADAASVAPTGGGGT